MSLLHKGNGESRARTWPMWLVLGEQQEALGLERTAPVATLWGVYVSVGTLLFNALSVCPA